MTQSIPRSEPEICAHLAHLAGDIVLQHPLAQSFPFNAVEGLLAVARQDPNVDVADAQQLVRQALALIVEAEVLAAREVGQ